MSTPTPSPPASPAAVDRGPLRLRVVTPAGAGHLDGGWWPRGRDLATEVEDLVDHFPAHLGRITRVLYSPPDWDGAVPHVRVAGRQVETCSLPHDDTHHVDVLTTDRTTLRLLVVPPDFNDADGEEALLAAATPGNSHAAEDLLRTVTDEPDVDPRDRWRDDGSAGWGYETAEPPPG
ncbi:hypothetical protein ASG88_04985 [Nocardioides sp. Soil777]|uniref:DUF5994 family protein n=1 Tax=Nocardioides sp. Soil777 TaxID=1736409 RepID=UPI000703A74F|nr:DUF5994 family protein [Nocardioides sp. Soil777]KRF02722.1 hypothetical protein ASG88_04985 [Nocardioides sp. Soil777]